MPRLTGFVVAGFALTSSLAWGVCSATGLEARGQGLSASRESNSASCPFVTAAELESALLVDVRPDDALLRVRIEGAVMAGLADLESFVPRDVPAVLVGTGLDGSSLMSSCLSLRSRGWSLGVLKGGVQALPAELRQTTDAMAVFKTTPEEVATRLRTGAHPRLFVAGSTTDWVTAAEVLGEPTVGDVRKIAAVSGEVIFAGPKPWAESWIALLRGPGEPSLFWMAEDAAALASASAAIDVIHQGTHWVPPTPCERQSL